LLRSDSEALDAALPASSLPPALLIEKLPLNYLSVPQARETLQKHYDVAQLDAFLTTDSAAHALGLVVTYALRTQKQERLAHLRLPVPLHQPTTMVLGPRTAQHLDLLPSLENGQSLYSLINRTRSALGARHLKRWLLEPLRDPGEILARQSSVRELSESPVVDKISTAVAEIYDLERIAGRVNARLANPRDTLALGRSLAQLPELSRLLSQAQSPLLKVLSKNCRGLPNLFFRWANASWTLSATTRRWSRAKAEFSARAPMPSSIAC
jgi:DNA mismatch repair protein MutS